MKKIISTLVLFCISLSINAQEESPYVQDFLQFWNVLDQNYGYFHLNETQWDKVKDLYLPEARNIQSDYNFTLFLESVLMELYDHHTNLHTNTDQSYRLIPSKTDIWCDCRNGLYYVTEVHPVNSAYLNIEVDDQILQFNDQPIQEAVKKYMGRSFRQINDEIRGFACRLLLAGSYSGERKLQLKGANGNYIVNMGLGKFPPPYNGPLLNTKVIGEIGYIRIENSLGNNNLIPAFDKALDSLMNTRGLIIDLRHTPGGGNTTVARAIMGRFIDEERFYQKHVLPPNAEPFSITRSWAEIVSPRASQYKQPLVILVNHWTGSMGEGMAIGFDAIQRATVVGTRMAGLKGSINNFTLSNTNYGVSYSRENLYHMDGRRRETFVPDVFITPSNKEDVFLKKALEILNK